jgi:hypothetical protein
VKKTINEKTKKVKRRENEEIKELRKSCRKSNPSYSASLFGRHLLSANRQGNLVLFKCDAQSVYNTSQSFHPEDISKQHRGP